MKLPMFNRSLFGLFLCSFLLSSITHAQELPPDFSDALVLGGFTEPVGCTWDANGRSYVWEKGGKVWIIENGVRLPSPLIDLSEEVGNWRDHGMLGFTLDPNFANNGRIYLLYVVDRHHLMNYGTPAYNPGANEFFNATIVRCTRYVAIGPAHNTVDPTSRTVLIGETPQTGGPILHESHGAGSLVFGTDGTLLVSIGDGGTYYSTDMGNAPDTYHEQALADGIIRPQENVGSLRAQMVNSHSGKILRIDPNTGDGIPGNPWFDAAEPRAPRSRVWAMGVRNAYRFTVRQGSGSTDPAAADPGTIYMGDVGWNLWEELNICDQKGLNFGWPLFEGFNTNPNYMNVPVANLDVPNPNFNGIDCTQPYYNFQDLIVQATPIHSNAHPEPCDPQAQIPNSIVKHFHARPAIDWRHGMQSRTGGFVGNVPVTYNLIDPASPVPGPLFGGFAAIGGPVMEGLQLPIGFQGASFHGDYAMGFIKRFMFDEQDNPVSVHDFAEGLGAVTWIGGGPDGCIWYIRYNTNELRRICYDQAVDLPPVAVAEQSAVFGPAPLNVSFMGSNSSDPGGGPLSYLWEFGDGDTSTDPDPDHIFTAPNSDPISYTVTLTVTDQGGQSASTTLLVSLNNTPPVVDITSFEDGAFYPVGVDTVFTLVATVSDAEHDDSELTYAWRTALHHNTHNHPEPVDNNEQTITLISGVGCDGEEYRYNISLTVTDAGGLSTTVQQWIYPACHLIGPTAVINADPMIGFAPLAVQFDGTASYDPGEIVSYQWDFGDNTFSTQPTPTKTFTTEGPNYVTLTVTDDDGLTHTAQRVINVITLDPPQCAGPIGGILREVWTEVTGVSIASLVAEPSYPASPDSIGIISSLQAPQGAGTNYGSRLRGWIVPETSGTYTFTLTSNDASVAYLSLNADPVNRVLIANVPGSTLPDEYDAYLSQVSDPIQLQAGVFYYVELLHKQGATADHLTLRWQMQGDPAPVVVPGSVLAPWIECLPRVQLRVLLQGAWDPSDASMRDDLRITGSIPLTEPYSAMGFNITDGPNTIPASMLAVTGQNAIVDWVLVELRSASDPSVIVASQAALVQRDGDVVGGDQYHKLLFDVDAGAYHVAVRHRNHLGAMTAVPIDISGDGALVDLADPAMPTFGTDAQRPLLNGKRALWAGNVLHDDRLSYTGTANDREPILQDLGGEVPTNVIAGYYKSDVNMDGYVKYVGRRNDRDPILVNIGGTVPTAIRQEQLP